MSISFACGQCGKPFTVDDQFAGKKGKCKQCGATMQIPSASPSRSVAREISPSRRAPSAVTAAASTPANDVYGFEDEPLPPRSSARTLRERDEDSDDSPIPPRVKKKNSVGLFAGSPQKTAPNGQSAGTIVARVVVVIVLGIGVILLCQPGVRQTLMPGWAMHGDIEAFIKKQVDETNALTSILRGVTDIPSATAASSSANATVRKLTENLRSNKDRKGNQKDIDSLKQKYAFAQQQALNSFTQEFTRVAMIPGAVDALAIMPALQELAAIESSIPGGGAQNNFIPPRIPSMPRPNFNPPPMPRFNPPQPNFNPPQPNISPPMPNFNPPMPGQNRQPGGMPPRSRPRPRIGGPG